MKHLIIACAILFSTQVMAQFKEYRELIILPVEQDKILQSQLSELSKDSAGLKERDMKVTICSDNACRMKYTTDAGQQSFTVVLVGKDGGVKKQWTRLVTIKEIFALIDAMPMRRSEMKTNRN